jgi:hypothetical protein
VNDLIGSPATHPTTGVEETPGEEQVDPSLLSEVNGRSVLRAWEQALRLLQGELSPGSYQTYLARARPRIWEAEGRLVVRRRRM